VRLKRNWTNTKNKKRGPDALREIVAKIVREELKGHLCDQITAKIRQMVQREIKA